MLESVEELVLAKQLSPFKWLLLLIFVASFAFLFGIISYKLFNNVFGSSHLQTYRVKSGVAYAISCVLTLLCWCQDDHGIVRVLVNSVKHTDAQSAALVLVQLQHDRFMPVTLCVNVEELVDQFSNCSIWKVLTNFAQHHAECDATKVATVNGV